MWGEGKNLTKIICALPIEEYAEYIRKVEGEFYDKYGMIGNPYCTQNRRGVTIANSAAQVGDNFLEEFIVDDKVVGTIYGRRNDFNSLDLLVSDFGPEYYKR